MSEVKSELEVALARLHNEGGSGNRLVVSRGPAWFVLRAAKGDRQAQCIAVTQKHLSDALTIPPEGIIALRRADFAKSSGERALSRKVDIASHNERSALASLLLDWFQVVFDLEATLETRISLKLGDLIVMNNEPLHQAIRVLAKERSHHARQTVYRALLSTKLQLVVDENGAPAPTGALGGAHTYAVFTSAAEADLWDPRGIRVKVLPSWSIFPMLSELNPGSLQINPDGRLGGELYRNEVESLAHACGSYRHREDGNRNPTQNSTKQPTLEDH